MSEPVDTVPPHRLLKPYDQQTCALNIKLCRRTVSDFVFRMKCIKILTSSSDLIDSYLNGPRTLSNDRLSYLIVSSDDPSQGMEKNFDFLICATHFLGDGMALHQFANDFFTLLGGPSSIEDLQTKLSMEWQSRVQKKPPTLPSSMEDRLPLIASQGFGPVVARVDFQETQRKLIVSLWRGARAMHLMLL